jgi:hypothetical protein
MPPLSWLAASTYPQRVTAPQERAKFVPQRMLNYWLEGGECQGRQHKPVICVEPKGDHPLVTGAEFIEAGLLREYRKAKSRWRAVKAPHLVAPVRAGARFERGVLAQWETGAA